MEAVNLKGRVALITGGSNETGQAICHLLSKAGAGVIVHYYKNEAAAKRICRDISSEGGIATLYSADLSDKDSVESLFRSAREHSGRLDILVNNAHLPISRCFFKDISWEEHQEQINVMLKGAFYCSHEALSMMGEQGGGSIINILTTQIDHPVKGYSSYVTAASSLVGFSRNLAVELGGMGIRVNMIAPGFVLTGHTPHAPLHVQESIRQATPLRRLATPEDIAKAALFFASDMSGFITGSCLTVDGGLSLTGNHPPSSKTGSD